MRPCQGKGCTEWVKLPAQLCPDCWKATPKNPHKKVSLLDAYLDDDEPTEVDDDDDTDA